MMRPLAALVSAKSPIRCISEVVADQVRSTADLWVKVAAVRDGLRNAGHTAEADRLEEAMTVSAHPGEVWPATREVLRDLLRRRLPLGMNEAAAACVAYLDTWP